MKMTRSVPRADAKFTIEQVRYIRASSKSQRELAREFGVAMSTIHNIRHRRTWGWVK